MDRSQSRFEQINENFVLITYTYTSNEDSDEPVLPHNIARAFAARICIVGNYMKWYASSPLNSCVYIF